MKLAGLRIQECRSFLSKLHGFMFSFSRKKAKIFIFTSEKNVWIHMLFVFMPLIAIWLDDKKRIADFRLMLPFMSRHSAKARYAIEIPYNSRNKQIFRKLRKGMKIEF